MEIIKNYNIAVEICLIFIYLISYSWPFACTIRNQHIIQIWKKCNNFPMQEANNV